MSELFSNLPEGCFHLKGFLSDTLQKHFLEVCRDHSREYRLVRPTTKGGHPLSLSVTSWGRVGWWGQQGKYLYITQHPESRKPWPSIPVIIMAAIRKALRDVGLDDGMDIHTVLMNYYPPEIGKLGRHQDVTEQDLISPIVTISLGDSCIFNIGTTEYTDKGIDFEVHSGDVVIMSGPSRLAYHGVKKLTTRNPLLKNGGRISLTARKVYL